MKRFISIVLPIVALAAPAVFSQDPGFRPAASKKTPAAAPVAAAPAPKDDTAGAVAQLSSMDSLDSSYRLGIGDQVVYRIVQEGEKVNTAVVQDSGNIMNGFIGLVPVAGKTCKEVAYYMKRELEKKHFQQATVILALERQAPRRQGPGIAPGPAAGFTVFGQVSRQGKYDMDPAEDLTISQAILKAGGFSQFAKDTKVKVIRKTPDKGSITILVDVRAIMMKGKLEYDIPIKGGDVIIVDEKIFNF